MKKLLFVLMLLAISCSKAGDPPAPVEHPLKNPFIITSGSKTISLMIDVFADRSAGTGDYYWTINAYANQAVPDDVEITSAWHDLDNTAYMDSSAIIPFNRTEWSHMTKIKCTDASVSKTVRIVNVKCKDTSYTFYYK